MSRIKIKLDDSTKVEELGQEIYNDLNSQMNLINNKMNELVNSTPISGDVTVYDKTTLTNSVANLIKLKDSTIRAKLDLAKMMKETNKKTGDLEKEEKTTSQSKFSFDKMKEFIENNNKGGKSEEYKLR